MLNAVQENSPVNVVQVLEKVIVSILFCFRMQTEHVYFFQLSLYTVTSFREKDNHQVK